MRGRRDVAPPLTAVAVYGWFASATTGQKLELFGKVLHMDFLKSQIVGILTRIILAALAFLCAKTGYDSANNANLAQGIAEFAGGVVIAGLSAWWSLRTRKTLLNTTPPGE